jgi:hypothetical protein
MSNDAKIEAQNKKLRKTFTMLRAAKEDQSRRQEQLTSLAVEDPTLKSRLTREFEKACKKVNTQQTRYDNDMAAGEELARLGSGKVKLMSHSEIQ